MSPRKPAKAALTTVKDATFGLLRAFGIKRVFGNPGSTELPFLSDWPDDIDYVLGLQEASVVGMADGYAQATRNAGFVNLHSGAGVGNALGNIYTAHRNQTPMVITAGQQARSILPLQAFLYAERASEFPRPYVKYSVEPARPEDVPAAIARAYYVAMQPPCGPTFVSIPIDDWTRPAAAVEARHVSRELGPELEAVKTLAAALSKSKRPALVAGPGVDRAGAVDLMVQVAEKAKASVWVSPFSARCSFPERHPQFAGFLHASPGQLSDALRDHDIVVVIGAPVFTFHVEGHASIFDGATAIFQITDDPDAAAVLKAFRDAGRPPYETLTPPEARELYLKGCEAARPETPELASVKPLDATGPNGAIPMRVYRPRTLRETNGRAPCLVFYHGGGWVIGDLDSHDAVCRILAHEGQLLVIAVDYRLSPEHKFPTAVNDAVAAAQWIAANADSLGIDPARLMVGGDSAGGNLAAVVALAARDGGPKLGGQVLIYPVTDLAMTHPSHSDPDTSVLLTHSLMRWFKDHYITAKADIDDWRASPARMENLKGLPQAYVITAGADPLHDEGVEYRDRLKSAGVEVTYNEYPGQFHGFWTMGKLLPEANKLTGEIAAWLKSKA